MTRFSPARRSWMTLTACAVLLAGSLHGRAQTNAEPEEFTAFTVNLGRLATATTGQIIINITRWSSQDEQEAVLTALREKGQRGMLEAFRSTKRVGSIRSPHSIGYDLQLAYQQPAPDGRRRIIIATDRPVSFAEATNRPPTMDYPFTVIEMLLHPDGTGEGTMSLAARFVPAGKTVVVENFDTQPVQLKNIESRKR